MLRMLPLSQSLVANAAYTIVAWQAKEVQNKQRLHGANAGTGDALVELVGLATPNSAPDV